VPTLTERTTSQSDRQAGNATLALLPPKVWHKLERADLDYSERMASPSRSPERFADGEIALI
jgi:hypothetical protein